MDKSLKRIVAFILDIFLVTFVVTALTVWAKLDPYQEKYTEAYDEYVEVVTKAQEEDNIDKYEDRIIELNYEIYEYKVVSNIVSIVAVLLYFGVIQCVWKGQTVGKKIMNLKVESNTDKPLNIGNYLIRVIILNNVILSVISIIAVYITSGMQFYYVIYVISLLQSTIYIVNVLMMVLRKDNRGLHDILTGTKVIDLKENIEEKEELEVEEVEEVTEEKNNFKKTTKKKTSKSKKSVDK